MVPSRQLQPLPAHQPQLYHKLTTPTLPFAIDKDADSLWHFKTPVRLELEAVVAEVSRWRRQESCPIRTPEWQLYEWICAYVRSGLNSGLGRRSSLKYGLRRLSLEALKRGEALGQGSLHSHVLDQGPPKSLHA